MVADLVDDVSVAMLVAIGALTVALHAWSILRPGSRLTPGLRRVWSIRLVASLLAFTVFAALAEDVLEGERNDLVLILDHALRPIAQATAALPGVRAGAQMLGWLTGEGMALVLLAAAALLFAGYRRKEAAIVVFGTLSAWGASGLMKVLLAIPRPRPARWQYGFPSGHAFVTLVALGLIAWVVGRRASSYRQTWFMAAAVGVAILTGVSRLLLDVHWLSDVIAGLAVGTVWLNATIALAERRLALESSPPAPVRRSHAAARRSPPSACAT